MLISQCITERCENYSHNGDSLSLSIFDHNTENKVKYYVACVFVSALDVKCFVINSERNLSRFTPVSGATYTYLLAYFISL